MKIIATILIALANSMAFAGYSQTLKLWENGDFAVQQIRDQEYLDYTDQQLSQLLPVLATWIPLQDELGRHPDDSWRAFESEDDWTPFLNALPPDHAIRRRWELSQRAASVIRVLAEKRRMNVESLLPILIEGVAHPSLALTGRDCFYSLTALTKLYDGSLTSWTNIPHEAKKISEWFEAWRKVNQEKKLIVTVDREKEIHKDYLSLTVHLEELVSDRSHGLHGFRAPTEKDDHRAGEPLFGIRWDGWNRSSVREDPLGDGWVWVMVRPQTKLIEGIKTWEQTPSWDALEALPEGARIVYSRPIENSDWGLEVYVNRITDPEIESLSSGLKMKAERR
ncbi:MAG: hypothetical protein ACI9R3_006475 [Verrucomicrobiales bacterium]|jgi:hypothetical protein